MKADITVYSKDEKPQLIIEIKRQAGVSAEWAAKIRRNLLVHGGIQPTPFFLLVSSDYLYLWKDATSFDVIAADYQIETAKVLSPYIKQTALKLEEMSEYSLEMVVMLWLNDIIRPRPDSTANGSDVAWLYESGLYKAIRDGAIMTEVA